MTQCRRRIQENEKEPLVLGRKPHAVGPRTIKKERFVEAISNIKGRTSTLRHEFMSKIITINTNISQQHRVGGGYHT